MSNCLHCGKEFSPSPFVPSQKYCKPTCGSAARYLINRDKILGAAKSWQRVNHEAHLERQAQWRAENPDKVKARNKRSRFLVYGVDEEWFRNQLVGQAGRCAMCWRVMQPGKDTQVDHDHTTGAVRALLCGRCNRTIGHAGDEAAILRKGIVYLESFAAAA